MTTTHDTVLITGATGAIGSRVARLARSHDVPVRLMARREEQVRRFTEEGFDAVRGDFADPASVARAAAGCAQALLVPPSTEDTIDADLAAVDALTRAGVAHVLKVSAMDANPHSPVPWAAAHARSDARLRESGTPWTLLRPGAFLSNLEQLAPAVRHGVLLGASGPGAATWTDVEDIAAAAMAVLLDPARRGGPGAAGRTWFLNGTEPHTFPEIATTMSEVFGRRVRYVDLPGPVMGLGLRAAGVSAWQAHGLVAQFAIVVRHGFDRVREEFPDLVDLIGREPVTLEAYLRRERARFTS